MPIIAVAGIIGGASALAAGGLTALGTIAAIGGIVSGIGSLTGNKAMMQIGGIASLAGGIGAFASSQGWMATSSATDTAADAAASSDTIDALKSTDSGAEVADATAGANPTDARLAAGTQASPMDAGQLDVGAAADQTTQGLANTQSISDTVSQASPELAKAAGPVAPGGLMDATNPTDMRLQDGVQQSPLQSLNPPDTSTLGGAPTASPLANANDTQLAAGTKTSPMDVVNATSSTTSATSGGKVLDLFNQMFRDKDGKLDKNMLSLAGNFVGGMFDAEKKAKADYYAANSDMLRQQMANANAVPAMNFSTAPRPNGVFRPTQPTYQPVRVGGLYTAR